MTDKTKDSWLVESDNFCFQVRPFFFGYVARPAGSGRAGTRMAPGDPCAKTVSLASTGSTHVSTNFSRRETFVFRYVANFFGYVRPSVRYGRPSHQIERTEKSQREPEKRVLCFSHRILRGTRINRKISSPLLNPIGFSRPP